MPPKSPKNKNGVEPSYEVGSLAFATIDLKMTKEKALLIKWPCKIKHILDLEKDFYTRKRKESKRGPGKNKYLVSLFGRDRDTFIYLTNDKIEPYTKNNYDRYKTQDPTDPSRKEEHKKNQTNKREFKEGLNLIKQAFEDWTPPKPKEKRRKIGRKSEFLSTLDELTAQLQTECEDETAKKPWSAERFENVRRILEDVKKLDFNDAAKWYELRTFAQVFTQVRDFEKVKSRRPLPAKEKDYQFTMLTNEVFEKIQNVVYKKFEEFANFIWWRTE